MPHFCGALLFLERKEREVVNKKMVKSILAIVVGFILVGVLSIGTDLILEATHIFPPISEPQAYTWKLLLLALIFRTVYAGIGGYITAILAPNKKMEHVIILAAIGLIVAIIGALSHTNLGNVWYPISLAILSPIAVVLGAKIKVGK